MLISLVISGLIAVVAMFTVWLHVLGWCVLGLGLGIGAWRFGYFLGLFCSILGWDVGRYWVGCYAGMVGCYSAMRGAAISGVACDGGFSVGLDIR